MNISDSFVFPQSYFNNVPFWNMFPTYLFFEYVSNIFHFFFFWLSFLPASILWVFFIPSCRKNASEWQSKPFKLKKNEFFFQIVFKYIPTIFPFQICFEHICFQICFKHTPSILVKNLNFLFNLSLGTFPLNMSGKCVGDTKKTFPNKILEKIFHQVPKHVLKESWNMFED